MSTLVPQISEDSSLTARSLSLLIVADDRFVRNACQDIAQNMGFRVYTAESTEAAIQRMKDHATDVVFLDPGPDGLESLLKIKQQHPKTEVVMMTEPAAADSVLTAMKSGAYDYLLKPFAEEELRSLLERLTEHLRFSLASRASRESIKSNPGYGGMVGRAPEMERLYRIVAKVACSTHPVLIHGESGSGKEMVARAIHFTGLFRDRSFIPVDCGALAPTLLEGELFGYVKGAFTGAVRAKEGLLSLAKGGTIFLDEISEMPVELQTKLLRALQEREIRPLGSAKASAIDVRIIAATTRDLEIAVHQGSFRRDLFSRLNVVSLKLPPLRERKQDIELLVDHFLDRISRSRGMRLSLSPDAMKQLLAYDWPGNVRELEHCLERAAALSSGPLLKVSDLALNLQVIPISNANPKPRIVPLVELEKQAIIGALKQLHGDKLMAAKMLGIGKTTLYRKLKEYGISERWAIAMPEDEPSANRQAG